MTSNPSGYYQTHEFSTTLGGQPIHVISKPGIASWDAIAPSTALLADAVDAAPDSRILLLGSGHGALGVALARRIPAGEVWLFDPSVIAMNMAEQTLQANHVTNAQLRREIGILPEQIETFDAVVVEAPKDRKLARHWLVEAQAALKTGGQLFVAGANEHGIRSAIADAEALFGSAVVLAYKKGNRVARTIKRAKDIGRPVWASEPGIAPGTWYEFEVELRGRSFRLCSLPGVFAYDRLDEGTRLLLTTLALPQHARVLDIGCGYGIIGLVAAHLGAEHVDMVDTNLLAVAAAGENIARNTIANAQVLAGDGIRAVQERRYQLIATNPPFHVGGAVDYDVARAFIDYARRVLAPGGQLLLVTNQFIRYDQLLHSTFEHVECLAQTASYRVLKAT
jgi:16S rRNA (guanine1207-N2)-methyltransferase